MKVEELYQYAEKLGALFFMVEMFSHDSEEPLLIDETLFQLLSANVNNKTISFNSRMFLHELNKISKQIAQGKITSQADYPAFKAFNELTEALPYLDDPGFMSLYTPKLDAGTMTVQAYFNLLGELAQFKTLCVNEKFLESLPLEVKEKLKPLTLKLVAYFHALELMFESGSLALDMSSSDFSVEIALSPIFHQLTMKSKALLLELKAVPEIQNDFRKLITLRRTLDELHATEYTFINIARNMPVEAIISGLTQKIKDRKLTSEEEEARLKTLQELTLYKKLQSPLIWTIAFAKFMIREDISRHIEYLRNEITGGDFNQGNGVADLIGMITQIHPALNQLLMEEKENLEMLCQPKRFQRLRSSTHSAEDIELLEKLADILLNKLIVPVQRGPRYILLMQTINAELNKTSATCFRFSSKDEIQSSVRDSLTRVTCLSQQSNEAQRRDEVFSLLKSFAEEQLNVLDLVIRKLDSKNPLKKLQWAAACLFKYKFMQLASVIEICKGYQYEENYLEHLLAHILQFKNSLVILQNTTYPSTGRKMFGRRPQIMVAIDDMIVATDDMIEQLQKLVKQENKQSVEQLVTFDVHDSAFSALAENFTRKRDRFKTDTKLSTESFIEGLNLPQESTSTSLTSSK